MDADTKLHDALADAREVFDTDKYADWVEWVGALMPKAAALRREHLEGLRQQSEERGLAEEEERRREVRDKAVAELEEERKVLWSRFEDGGMSISEFDKGNDAIDARVAKIEEDGKDDEGTREGTSVGEVAEELDLIEEVASTQGTKKTADEDTEMADVTTRTSRKRAVPVAEVPAKRPRTEEPKGEKADPPVSLQLSGFRLTLTVFYSLVRSMSRIQAPGRMRV